MLILFLLSGFFSGTVFAGSGTGIANGGDPVFSFLSSTRFAYAEALKDISLDPSLRKNLCGTVERLSTEQKALCQEFLVEVQLQLLALNESVARTEFVLRKEPLLVEGPDGKPMPVAARPALGALGPIEFHRSSIAYLPPRQMLLLIAHEFGHKADFRGHPLSDNEKIGAFASGRELLDAAAEAVVALAEAKGRIGKSFGLRDFWQCQVAFANGPITGVSLASLRLFFKNDLDQYQGGISRGPDDPELYAYEELDTRLVFRIQVNEKLGCLGVASTPAERSTKLEILRQREKAINGEDPGDEVVASIDLPFVNPICEEKPRWLELRAGSVGFRCRYSGSQGGFQ